MRMTNRNHSLTLAVLLGLLLLALIAGCESERVPTSLPGTHPDRWMDPASPDFHGKLVLADGTESCAHCHGIEDKNGKVDVSCLDCHGPNGSACIGCHGGLDNSTGAPPYGLDGETADTSLAVGAHTAHLDTTALAGPVACNSCHIVPAFLSDLAHLDLDRGSGLPLDSIAEIVWGGFADGGGAAWDRDSRTCSNIYCHGNFTGGDTANTPIWTGSNQATCGSCHDIGADPASLQWKHDYHVNNAGLFCADCHAGVVDTLLNISQPLLHVNGIVDTLTRDTTVCARCHSGGTLACTGCHGGVDSESGAPPLGLRGETHTTQLAVGAHTAHLSDGTLADAFACDECHVVPSDIAVPGHIDADSIAEITWGPLAGSSSNWNRVTATCNSTYCHGNFTGGTASNAPVWTGSDQAACGSCHDVGSDPASLGWKHDYHVNTAGLSCGECHAATIDTLLNIIDIAMHVNGAVDTLTRDTTVCAQCHGDGGCTGCHGGVDNTTGAPPLGLHDETNTSDLAVGAHTIHMEGGSFADAFSCEDCHIVPGNLAAPSHIDGDGIAELTFSTLAGTGTNWDRAAATCSNNYCHGSFTGGTASNAPVWTGTNQATCGSCHDVGTNPLAIDAFHEGHVGAAGLLCADCHASVVDQFQQIIGLDLHVNGQIDTLIRDTAVCDQCHGSGAEACTSCHGGVDNTTGAPPTGLRGETSTSQLAVGAHTIHLEGGSLADAFACSECHIVPTSLLSPGHWAPDSVAEMTFSALATGTSWDRTAATCSNNYCHGDFAGGYTGNAPVWTGSNQAQCGSCHDAGTTPSDLGGRHYRHVIQRSLSCYECHFSVVDVNDSIVGPDLHVDGTNNVAFRLGGTYNNGTCSGLNNSACHGTHSW